MITQESKRFRAFRKFIKISQKDLASNLGISQSDISKYENGEYQIPIEVIRRLNEKYQMNYEWFFNGIRPMQKPMQDSKSLTTDISQMKSEHEILIEKIKSLESMLKKIARDFYQKS